jgi:hypothetical protein
LMLGAVGCSLDVGGKCKELVSLPPLLEQPSEDGGSNEVVASSASVYVSPLGVTE